MRLGVVASCILFLASSNALAVLEDEEKWLACETDGECTSVKLGCYYWQSVNKAYAAAMEKRHRTGCKKSRSAGPRPHSSCFNNLCVKFYTGEDWKRLEDYQKRTPGVGRMDECIRIEE